jgi:hypothetical protein
VLRCGVVSTDSDVESSSRDVGIAVVCAAAVIASRVACVTPPTFTPAAPAMNDVPGPPPHSNSDQSPPSAWMRCVKSSTMQ